jgi:cullin-4
VEEARHAAQAIDFNREASLDAAIVRIMKAKKTLGNTEVINLTIDAVKKHFTPQPASIIIQAQTQRPSRCAPLCS